MVAVVVTVVAMGEAVLVVVAIAIVISTKLAKMHGGNFNDEQDSSTTPCCPTKGLRNPQWKAQAQMALLVSSQPCVDAFWLAPSIACIAQQKHCILL